MLFANPVRKVFFVFADRFDQFLTELSEHNLIAVPTQTERIICPTDRQGRAAGNRDLLESAASRPNWLRFMAHLNILPGMASYAVELWRYWANSVLDIVPLGFHTFILT